MAPADEMSYHSPDPGYIPIGELLYNFVTHNYVFLWILVSLIAVVYVIYQTVVLSYLQRSRRNYVSPKSSEWDEERRVSRLKQQELFQEQAKEAEELRKQKAIDKILKEQQEMQENRAGIVLGSGEEIKPSSKKAKSSSNDDDFFNAPRPLSGFASRSSFRPARRNPSCPQR